MILFHRPDGVPNALPFWLSLALVPVIICAATIGGWALILPPLASWGLFSLLDRLIGKDGVNPDPDAVGLGWHTALLWVWGPVQVLTLFGVIASLDRLELSPSEAIALFFGVGILTGTIGITFAHEIIHRPGRNARRLGDLMLASALYSHFRSEHLLVHHVSVATPDDPATARYGEGFWRYFLRALPTGLSSAWAAEAAQQRRRGHRVWHRSNPFWSYFMLQLAYVILATTLGGLAGVGLFLWQALVAVWQLELVNYVEHYGLTRQRLANGRYEPVQPHHSWNANFAGSNWLLINLQRHADHHVAPGRPFALLQSYGNTVAPNLPAGYPIMAILAMVPPIWHRRMNPKVRAWRQRHYPDITDWSPTP